MIIRAIPSTKGRTIMNSIDYGYGKTNIDVETDIRYGVISIHDILQSWCDSSESVYQTYCPHCESEIEQDIEACPNCKKEVLEYDFSDEPSYSKIESEGYEAIQSGGSSDIFVTKSPFYTFCNYCSPCAPGAGDLRSPCDGGAKTYCFGHDWFEDGKAPYIVYSVETNEVVS